MLHKHAIVFFLSKYDKQKRRAQTHDDVISDVTSLFAQLATWKARTRNSFAKQLVTVVNKPSQELHKANFFERATAMRKTLITLHRHRPYPVTS